MQTHRKHFFLNYASLSYASIVIVRQRDQKERSGAIKTKANQTKQSPKTTPKNQTNKKTHSWKEKCIQLNITVSIENPENSLFWLTDPIQQLFRICPGNLNVFDSCMMGGDRDKATAWWCSDDLFSSLNLRCNKQHTHKPWTPIASSGSLKFPTAEEASYPELLMWACILLHCVLPRVSLFISHSFYPAQTKAGRYLSLMWPAAGNLPSLKLTAKAPADKWKMKLPFGASSAYFQGS